MYKICFEKSLVCMQTVKKYSLKCIYRHVRNLSIPGQPVNKSRQIGLLSF